MAGDDDTLTTIGLNWYPVSGLKVFTAYSFGEGAEGGTRLTVCSGQLGANYFCRSMLLATT